MLFVERRVDLRLVKIVIVPWAREDDLVNINKLVAFIYLPI